MAQQMEFEEGRRYLICSWCRGLFRAADVPRPKGSTQPGVVIGPRRRCPRCHEWGTVKNGMFIPVVGGTARALCRCVSDGYHLRLTAEGRIGISPRPSPEMVADIQCNHSALMRLLETLGNEFG